MTDRRLCPSCHKPYDNSGKQRRLLDSCGHERCYSCIFQQEGCSLCKKTKENVQCNENLCTPLTNRSQRSSSHPRIVQPADSNHLNSTTSASREEATTVTMRKRTASPRQSGRRSSRQRHSRRPQTVSVDDSTLSGETLTSQTLLYTQHVLKIPIECSTSSQWGTSTKYADLTWNNLGSR